MNIVNIKLTENYQQTISKIVENSSYASIKLFLNILPKEYESDEHLYYYGKSYINKLYKEMASLEAKKHELLKEINTTNIEEINKILEKQQIVYFTYTYVNYESTYINYDDFLTFSKLITFAFDEYNPNIIRESDNNPYRCDNKETEYVVNTVVRNIEHIEDKDAFEIDRTKLEILRTTLNDKCENLIVKHLNELNLDNYGNYLDEILTTPQEVNRIKSYIKKNKSGK